jgi:hypothetical protein
MEAAYLLLALPMEVAWIWPALALAGGPAATGASTPLAGSATILPLAWAFLLVVTGTVAGRVLTGTRIPLVLGRALASVAGLVAVALAARAACFAGGPILGTAWLAGILESLRDPLALGPPLRSFLVGGLLYWRGVSLGSEEVGPQEARHRFLVCAAGLVALLAVAAIVAAGGQRVGLSALSPWPVVALFASGLGLLGVANLAEVSTLGPAAPKALRGAGTARWAGIAAVWVAGLLGVGVAVAAAVSPGTVLAALRLLSPVWWLLSRILYALLAVVGFIAFAVASLVWRLLGREGGLDVGEMFRLAGSPVPTDAAATQPALPGLLQAMRWVVAAAVVAGVLYAFARALRRRHRLAAGSGAEWRESVWSWRGARAGLLAALRGLGRRLAAWRGQPVASLEHLPPGMRQARALYRAALRSCARAGRARRSPETPDEFAPSLDRLCQGWGGDAGAAASMTGVYNVARYGERSPDGAALAAAVAAWRNARPTAGRAVRAGRPRGRRS